MTDREELQERLDELEDRYEHSTGTDEEDEENWLERLEREAHEIYPPEKIEELETLAGIVEKNGFYADRPIGQREPVLTYAGAFYVDYLMESAAYDLEQRGL